MFPNKVFKDHYAQLGLNLASEKLGSKIGAGGMSINGGYHGLPILKSARNHHAAMLPITTPGGIQVFGTKPPTSLLG